MCRGPRGSPWQSWQDVALSDSDMSPASPGDRELCAAWASDQTLPQSQATLFSKLEVKTSTGARKIRAKGIVTVANIAGRSRLQGHVLECRDAHRPFLFRAARGGQRCATMMPVCQRSLRLREAKTLAPSQTEAKETGPQPWLSHAAATHESLRPTSCTKMIPDTFSANYLKLVRKQEAVLP